MKIMFLISVLILLLQLCNAQLGLPILPTLTGDILNGGRHDRENQNKTSHSSENGGLPILSTLTRGILNDRENQNNEPHSSGNSGLPILSLTRSMDGGMDRGQSNRNRENQNNES